MTTQTLDQAKLDYFFMSEPIPGPRVPPHILGELTKLSEFVFKGDDQAAADTETLLRELGAPEDEIEMARYYGQPRPAWACSDSVVHRPIRIRDHAISNYDVPA